MKDPPAEIVDQGYIIKDPFFQFPSPKIRWVDPERLVPHEHYSKPHLENLLRHLKFLATNVLLPVPVVTSSQPSVILDGHHRVAASIEMGIMRIPVWEVDVGILNFNQGDDDPPSGKVYTLREYLDLEEERTSIRCYARADNTQIKIADVVNSARKNGIGFGIKGTRHVAIVGDDGLEVKLEKVTPRVHWGVWKSSGRLNVSEIEVINT